jgi:hypothetical protein
MRHRKISTAAIIAGSVALCVHKYGFLMIFFHTGMHTRGCAHGLVLWCIQHSKATAVVLVSGAIFLAAYKYKNKAIQIELRQLHVIDPYDINASELLKNMHSVSESLKNIALVVDMSDTIECPFSDNQLTFIAQLLHYIQAEQQTGQNLEGFIREYTRDFTTTSFADVLHLVNYFNIPAAFNMLISMQRPLPLPETCEQEVAYNKNLVAVFNLAKNSAILSVEYEICIGFEQLWGLFGSMLYKDCVKYPEINKMIDFVTDEHSSKLIQAINIAVKNVKIFYNDEEYDEKIDQIDAARRCHICDKVVGAYMARRNPPPRCMSLHELLSSSSPCIALADGCFC